MDHHPEYEEVLHHTSPRKAKQNRLLAGIASLVLVIGALVMINLPNTRTQGVSDYRNWSADAIIQGGATTEKELLQKYDANASGVQSIFHHYGIKRSDLAGQTSQIKHGVVYQDGTVKVDGKTVATGAYSVSRKPFWDSRGNAPRTVKVGNTTLYEGPNMSIFVRSVDAYVYFRNGAFYRAVISSCANPVVATATDKPQPVAPTPKPQPKPTPKPAATPVYSCDSLKATKINRTRFTFTTAATAKNGASIVSYSYNFGDGTIETVTGSSTTHEYANPGSYTVTVTVKVLVNGKTVEVPGNNCSTKVVVEEPPKVAVYKCDSLTAKAIQSKDRTYLYTLIYTAENGAILTGATYDFGDGHSKQLISDKATSVEYQYATPGTYTTTATLTFSVPENGTVVEKTSTCATKIVLPQPDMCPLPGKEDLPKNSPECVEPPIETPPELPQTGLGEWLAGAAGVAAVAAAIYYWNMSRKNLIKTMLKK